MKRRYPEFLLGVLTFCDFVLQGVYSVRVLSIEFFGSRIIAYKCFLYY